MANPVSKKEKPVRKPRQKNAPDRPQPAWLFPPDEENPVLNPQPKSKGEEKKEIDERLHAIDFLKHKAVGAPQRPAPPSELLQLIGAFLTSYGFNSTSRLFTVERQARQRTLGWDDEVGKEKFQKGMPSLIQIYKDWKVDWKAESDAASSSSGSETEGEEATDASSGSESSGSSSSGSSKQKSNEKKKKKQDVPKPAKKKGGQSKAKAGSSSTSSSSSDSDADDEDDAPDGAKTVQAAKPTVNGLISNLDRGSSPRQAAANGNASTSSSSDSEEDSTSSAPLETETKAMKEEIQKRKRSSSPKPNAESAKKAKKNSTPFQRVPSDTVVDPKLSSNAYQSYDYADRAFQDLSVTKGKGFTKEKNKKKRGSYRGGTIDVSGGRSVKFED